MFILNIEEVNNKKLYSCNKEMSDKLIKNGFNLLSIKDGIYYFLLSEKLKKFIVDGGENI